MPRDPSLKLQNKLIKNSKFLSSSIIINFYPEEVLQNEENLLDDSIEAKKCIQSAKLLLFSFQRLYNSIESSLKNFRVALIGYRFCVRYYLECLEKWKLLDQERSQKSYEIAYMDAFSIYVSTQHHLNNINQNISTNSQISSTLLEDRQQVENLLNETKIKIQHFREILKQLLGKQRYENRIEEIEAFVKTSIGETFNNLENSESINEESKISSESSTTQTNLLTNNYQSNNNNNNNNNIIPSTQINTPMTPERYRLERVSHFTGLHPNYILYELSFDPNYRLPVNNIESKITKLQNYDNFLLIEPQLTPQEVTQHLRHNPLSASQIIKDQMLRMMGDRLIGSMIFSTLNSFNEILVDNIYYVWYGDVQQIPSLNQPSPHGHWLPVKILNINNDDQTVDVIYHADGVIEKNVSFNRFKLKNHGRDMIGGGFLSNIVDVMNKIIEIINNKEFQLKISQSLNISHITHLIERQVFDMKEILIILDTVVHFIFEIQSDIKKNEYQKWYQEKTNKFRQTQNDLQDTTTIQLFNDLIVFLPLFFEMALIRIDELQLEMTNFYLGLITSYAINTVSETLLLSYQNQLLYFKGQPQITTLTSINFSHEDYSNYLPQTYKFLCNQLNFTDGIISNDILTYFIDCNLNNNVNNGNIRIEDIGIIPQVDIALILRAFCLLLQNPFDLLSQQGQSIIPETLRWDAERLSKIRSQIDSLAIVSTLLLTTKQFLLMKKIKITIEEENIFHLRLQELIFGDHITMHHITAEIQQFIESLCNKQTIILTKESLTTFENSLKQSLAQSNPVLSLFTKRIYKVLVKGILNLPFHELLPTFSLHSRSQTQFLVNLIDKCKKLFHHNNGIFGPLYSSILRAEIQYLLENKPVESKELKE